MKKYAELTPKKIKINGYVVVETASNFMGWNGKHLPMTIADGKVKVWAWDRVCDSYSYTSMRFSEVRHMELDAKYGQMLHDNKSINW